MTEAAPDIDAQARELLAFLDRPRRRARPRVSRSLDDAQDHEVLTPAGPVAAWRLGVGPAVLLVHGWEDDHALWGPLIDQFAQIGRAVVALDLPGHGLSQAEDPSLSSVGQAVLAVGETLGPIEAVVGHSYGCAASIHALANGLAAERAVMIASPVPATGPRRQLKPEDYNLPAEVVERANALRGERRRSGGFDVEGALAAMTAQALVLHSLDDEQCPFDNAVRMAELWQGARLDPLDELGHRWIAQDPAALQRIVDFVEGMG